MKHPDRPGRILLTLCLLTLSAPAADPPRLAPDKASAAFAAATTSPPLYESAAKMLATVTPAVVSVFPAQVVEASESTPGLDRFFGRSPENKDKNAPDNQRVQGVGSGVILTPDGWIVTNSHVVHFQSGKLADAISVQLSDYRRFDAVIVGVDPLTDIALLKIEAADLPCVSTRDSDTLQVGDDVYAVGNPFKLGITATRGMVSAVRRSSLGMNGDGGFESFIQTDAAINPGNSGGALVDAGGRLTGINTAIYGGIGGNVGIGFAVPANLFRSVITQLAEHGRVDRGFFGWQTEDVSLTDAKSAKLEAVAGAKISQVQENGPAAKAGVKSGDIIIRASGRPVFTRGDLRVEAGMIRPGGSLEVICQRDGMPHTLTITASSSAEKPEGSEPGAVFRLEALPGVDFRKGETGLRIETLPKSLTTKSGLTAGMEIVNINGRDVTTAQEAEAALRKGVNSIRTTYRGEEETFALRLPLDEKQP